MMHSISKFQQIICGYQLTLKFIKKIKRSRIVNTILKKNTIRGLMLTNFKTYEIVLDRVGKRMDT